VAPPWKTSTKTVPRSGYTIHTHQAAPVQQFSAPAALKDLSFGPVALFASMARASALSPASAALLAALQVGASALAEALVDDMGTSFDVTSELPNVADAERTAFSGRVGAGVCDLYMSNLGYIWRASAESVISTAAPLADFVYDGGPATGHGIVLAEAKGSFTGAVTRASIRRTTDGGYIRQVDPYIAQPTSIGPIVHGYAVGFGAQPGNAGAFLHITETGIPVTASPPPTGAPGDSTPPVSGAPNPHIALGTYRADFLLANAPSVVTAIDRLRAGDAHLDDIPDQEFEILEIDGRKFIVGQDPALPVRPWWWFQGGSAMFGIEESIADSFLQTISSLLKTGGVSPHARFSLPIMPLLLDATRKYLLFQDGLGVLLGSPLKHAGDRRWAPARGLT
jgi:hypothetical protein